MQITYILIHQNIASQHETDLHKKRNGALKKPIYLVVAEYNTGMLTQIYQFRFRHDAVMPTENSNKLIILIPRLIQAAKTQVQPYFQKNIHLIISFSQLFVFKCEFFYMLKAT